MLAQQYIVTFNHISNILTCFINIYVNILCFLLLSHNDNTPSLLSDSVVK